MLITYPVTGWSTFLSETEADNWMGKQLNDGGWVSLDPHTKEMLLIQTTAMIRLCNGITLPDDNEEDLREGQAYLLLQATRVDMTEFDANDRSITSESVDTISVSYDTNKKGDVTTFPSMTKLFLQQYGCKGGSSGFTMVKLGRN